MKQNWPIYLILCLIVVGQAATILYLTRKEKVDYGPLERIIERNTMQLRADSVLLHELSVKIDGFNDTLKVINNQKTTIRENYYRDVSSLLANDSTQRAIQYRHDFREATDWLLSGGYFER